MKRIIDLAEAKQIAALTHDIVVFTILWTGSLFTLYISVYGLERIRVEVKQNIREKLLEKLHTISYKTVISESHGGYVQRFVDDVEKIEPIIVHQCLELFGQSVLGIGALIFMLKMPSLLTPLSILPLPLCIGLSI